MADISRNIPKLSRTPGPNVDNRQKATRLVEEIHFVQTNQLKYDSLTKREIEIISLLMKGLNNPQIAERLFISRRTVEQHRKNINRKLEIKCYADLFRFGYSFGLG